MSDGLAGHHYVTVRSGGRVGFLLGPYDDHHEARANVARGTQLACDANSRAWFCSFGTARDPGRTRATVFGK